MQRASSQSVVSSGGVVSRRNRGPKGLQQEIREQIKKFSDRGLRPGAEMYHTEIDQKGSWCVVQSFDVKTGDIVGIFKDGTSKLLNVQTSVPIVGKCPFGDEYVYVDDKTVKSMKDSGDTEHVVSCISKESEIEIHFIPVIAFAD